MTPNNNSKNGTMVEPEELDKRQRIQRTQDASTTLTTATATHPSMDNLPKHHVDDIPAELEDIHDTRDTLSFPNDYGSTNCARDTPRLEQHGHDHRLHPSQPKGGSAGPTPTEDAKRKELQCVSTAATLWKKWQNVGCQDLHYLHRIRAASLDVLDVLNDLRLKRSIQVTASDCIHPR